MQKIAEWFKKIKNNQLIVKILFTLVILTTFRIAATITVPGVKLKSQNAQNSTAFLDVLNLLGGGGIQHFSIVALGISPYITASIIVQLLTTDAVPALAKWQKGGVAGKRKINILTRWITLVFGIMQGFALAAAMVNDRTGNFVFQSVIGSSTFVKYLFVVILLLGGTAFTLFLGERITKKGVGNGTSLIIFSGIVVRLPSQFKDAYNILVVTHANTALFVGVVDYVGYCLFWLLILCSILIIYLAERRIPIQQTGRAMSGKDDKLASLPIKLNPAGVIPVIFASSIISIPLTIAQFLPKWWNTTIWMQENLQFTSAAGLSIYLSFIILFTLFWSQIQTNPDQISENFQKNGTFILGIRPGEETRKYLVKIILRLSIFAAFYLAVTAGLPYFERLLGMQRTITIGGTGMIILVSVGIETIRNIESRRTTVKLSEIKRHSVVVKDKVHSKGMLW